MTVVKTKDPRDTQVVNDTEDRMDVFPAAVVIYSSSFACSDFIREYCY